MIKASYLTAFVFTWIHLGAVRQTYCDDGIDTSLRQLAYRHWELKDGLPQMTVMALVQTQDGYLWMGTQEGLVRFDGSKFTLIDSNISHITQDVTAILADQSDLWIGTAGSGLIHKTSGGFEHIEKRHGLIDPNITALLLDNYHVLWIGTINGGLCRYDGRKFEVYDQNDGLSSNHVLNLMLDQNHKLWISTQAGVDILENGHIRNILTSRQLNGANVQCMLSKSNHEIWLGTNRGLKKFDPKKIVLEDERICRDNSVINAMLHDSKSNLWLATDNHSICLLKDGKKLGFSKQDPRSSYQVISMTIDNEQNLWFGTQNSGLSRLRSGLAETYSLEDGLLSRISVAVTQDEFDNIWFGSPTGLHLIHNQNFTTYTTSNGLAGDFIMSLFTAHDGILWIGTRNNGLMGIDVRAFENQPVKQLSIKKTYTQHEGLTSNSIYSVLKDSQGKLWVGTNNTGVNIIDNDRIQPLKNPPKLTSCKIPWILEAKNNDVLVASSRGLFRFKAGNPNDYSEINGLQDLPVVSLYEDQDGFLWIGTYHHGLYVLRDKRLFSFSDRAGPPDNIVYIILKDDSDRLWMSSNRGISVHSRKQLIKLADGHPSDTATMVFGTDEGMLKPECTGNYKQAGFRMRDGTLWFCTVEGISRFFPKRFSASKPPLTVLIENVWVDGQAVSSPAIIQPGSKQIELRYSAPSLTSADKVQFKYRMKGFDEDWIQAGNRRNAFYTNVPPGDYTLEVKARHPNQAWSRKHAYFSLRLLPAYYQTSWFYMISVVTMLAGILAIHRFRVMRIERQKNALHVLVSDRTKELKTKKEQLEEQKDQLESTLVELEETRQELADNAHKAGMTEVATGILHNVGNLINTANITVQSIRETIAKSRMQRLSQATTMLKEHLTGGHSIRSEKTRDLIKYYELLTDSLLSEWKKIHADILILEKKIQSIVTVVQSQQKYATGSKFTDKFSLTQIVDDAIELFQQPIREHGIILEKKYLNSPDIVVQKHKLIHVLINLFDNAKDALASNTHREKRIVVQVSQDGHQIVLEIADNGCGMDPDTVKKVFLYGYSTKQTGHGFGLHSCFNSLKEMHATIQAQSEGLGKGSVFRVFFPM